MPHCIIEYAKNVEQTLAIKELVSLVHQSVFASRLFEESSIKTRAIEFEYYKTGLADTPFIHLTLKILDGRSHKQKKELSTLVINALSDAVTPPISLTVEVVDIDTGSYNKSVM